MSYIGRAPSFASQHAPDTFTGNDVLTSFTLSYPPGSATAIDVEISGVSQAPFTAYYLVGSQLHFHSAPPTPLGADPNIVVRYRNSTPTTHNQVGVSLVEEIVEVATDGQTVITLSSISYIPGTSTLEVLINAAQQQYGSYIETSPTSITFAEGLSAGDKVLVRVGSLVNQDATRVAGQVQYSNGGIGAVPRTVEDKLQEIVSNEDFGANDSGTVDSSASESFASTVANSIRTLFRSLWMYKFPKRGVKTWKRTFGTKDQAAVVSISAMDDAAEPTTEVLGFSTDSDVSIHPDRDSVGLFVQAQALAPLVTTANTTFTATSVTSADFATAIAGNRISLGMLIDTNESPKKTGVVNGISSSTNTVSVSAWYIVDGTRATGTPSNGTTVYVSPVTKVWAHNANVIIDEDSHATDAVGFELGLINHKTDDLGYLYDAVNLGTKRGGTAFQSRGMWNVSYFAYTGHNYGFVATTGIGKTSFLSQGSPSVGYESINAQEAVRIKNSNYGITFMNTAGDLLGYISGQGIWHRAKLRATIQANGTTIPEETVVCLSGIISSPSTVYLPPPADHAQRVLYLKCSYGSSAAVTYTGTFETGLSEEILTAGQCVMVISDGASWNILSRV